MILSELRHRDTWKRWGDTFNEEFFQSEGGREVRRGIELMHRNGSGVVISVNRITGRLDDPLPPSVGIDKLERVAVTTGFKQQMEWLDKRLERGEWLSFDDLSDLKGWIKGMDPGRGAGNNHSLLSAQELVDTKSWEARGRIPTFLNGGLDTYLGGGIGRGQLCVLQAPFKMGKSTLLMQIAYRAAAKKYHTLFLSCENYLDQMGERLSQIHRLFKRKRLPPQLKLQYHGHLSLEDVHAYVDEMGKVDFLIIDYFGKMDSKNSDWTERTTEIFNGLRDDIANKNDLVCWTATQEHDSPSWMKSSQRYATWGSKTQGQLADLLLGVNINQQMNTARFTVHGRRGQGKVRGEFDSYFNTDTGELRDL
jgi:archaellum biogenesis ATPase FlaH